MTIVPAGANRMYHFFTLQFAGGGYHGFPYFTTSLAVSDFHAFL
jgi:hypothetical protein